MFKKLISLASEKGYEMLKAHGANCPDCGKPLDLPPNLPQAGFKSTLQCSHCDWMGSIASLSRSSNDPHSATQTKPEDSKIRESIGVEKASWLIPAKRKFNFLMFFAFIWVGIISLITVGMITGGVKMEDGSEASPVFAGLFLVPFWAIGLGVGYAGLRMAYTELLVRVDESSVVLTRKFFNRMWDKRILRKEVGGVRLSESYRQNNQSVYQIEVENEKSDGKNIKFGSSLSMDEKRWLLGGLQDFLEIESKVLLKEGTKSQGVKALKEVDSKTLKIEKIGQAGFRITRIYRAGPWLMGIGFCLMLGTLVGMVAQWEGFDVGDGSGLSVLFNLIFSALPFLFTLIGFLIGLGMLAGGYWRNGRKKVFEFGRDTVTRSSYWRGERKKETFDRESFKTVSTSNSGHVNNEQRFKVELLGDQETLSVCDYENSDIAGSIEAWLQQWL